MDILITTTDSIEGATITRYIEVLRTSVVVGTDLALTDLFSGTNRKYSSQLNNSYDRAMVNLKMKGFAVGADAIVGLHTDFEEIFGKGKTKFVVSLVGTAVKLDCSRMPSLKTQTDTVSASTLRRQHLMLTLRKKMNDDNYALSVDDWDNILNYSLWDLAPFIYRRYLLLNKATVSNVPLQEKKLLLDNFIPFFKSMNYNDAADVIYGDVTTDPYGTADVVNKLQLFHPEKICSLLQPENKHLVIALLKADRPNYSLPDLQRMRQIVDYIDNLPDTGHYIEGKGTLFGKTGTLLVCERGHTSAVELGGHCTETLDRGLGICNLNVKGLTEAEIEVISMFKQKVDILSSLLEK